MKNIVSIALVFILMLSFALPAFAASNEAISAANELHRLGIFNGTGTNADGNPNFDLDRAPTRNEAVTMLVRILGQETEATARPWEMPFTDVPSWAERYVGYAYTTGLTSGTSATSYSGSRPVTAAQYLTFVLRALGYESGTDFQWDEPWKLSDQIGLTNGQYNENTSFNRGDVAIISNKALRITNKATGATLLDIINSINNNDFYTEKHLQGIWLCENEDYDYSEEYIFKGNTFVQSRISPSDSDTSYHRSTGTFEIEKGSLVLKGKHTWGSEKYSVTTKEFEVTNKIEFKSADSFYYGGYIYYRCPDVKLESKVLTWLQGSLSSVKAQELLSLIKEAIKEDSNGLKAILSASKYHMQTMYTTGSTYQQAKYYESMYLSKGKMCYSEAKSIMTKARDIISGIGNEEALSKCVRVIELYSKMSNIGSVDVDDLKEFTMMEEEVLKLMDELLSILNITRK